jgi:Sec-independent protein translocase protein TatA
VVKKIPLKEPKNGEVKKLKGMVRRLEKEVKRLRSELKSYEQAFERTEKFLEDHTENISLEELIKAANKRQTLKSITEDQNIKEVCKKCYSPEIKDIPTRFGKLRICTSCGDKEVTNESNNINDDGDYSQ